MSLSRRNFITLTGLSFTSIIAAHSLKNYYLRVANGKTTNTNKFGSLIPDPNGILDRERVTFAGEGVVSGWCPTTKLLTLSVC